MLIEKECREALDKIQRQCGYLSETFHRYAACEISIHCKVFEELIHEHFDNPPLTIDDLKRDQEERKNIFSNKSEREEEKTLFIQTLEGVHEASIGDYIIEGEHGEFYPCKPDIFTETYEEVN